MQKFSGVYFHLYAGTIKGQCLYSFFLSSTDPAIQNFSTTLYVPLYMALWIWDIFTWLLVTFVHDTNLQKFLQINTIVQYDTSLACLLAYTCMHMCVCLPSVTHNVWLSTCPTLQHRQRKLMWAGPHKQVSITLSCGWRHN